MLVFDAHLDLSMNALDWNRDYTQSIEAIRNREKHLTDKADRGKGVVCFEEMRKGGVALCVATQIARFVKPDNPLSGWHSQAQAYAHTQGQLAWYRAMEEIGELKQIRNKSGLQNHLEGLPVDGKIAPNQPIGYILSLEGADSMINLDYVERAYEYGLRAIGPAHYGVGVYAYGTDSNGGLGHKGHDLLKKMDELGIILDATHLCDESFWEAMDCFQGNIWASHHMTSAITPHNRQLTDDQIKYLIERNAVIGMAFDAWMIVPNWIRGKSMPIEMGVNIDKILDHLDHICQIAGNTDHVCIGSDLDGGFGKEQAPYDIETIADLQKIPELLAQRGYSVNDIQKIMWSNCYNFMLRSLPD